MDHTAGVARLHEDSLHHHPSSNNVVGTKWSTLPHQHQGSYLHGGYKLQHQHHLPQHSRSRSNSGRGGLLNTSTDSAVDWRGAANSATNDSVNASPHNSSPGPASTTHHVNNTSYSAGDTAAPAPPHNFTTTTTGNHPAAGMDQKKEVKLNSMEWFHGKISRDEAEKLLQPREDGLFLVRESTNFPGDYTLCVCYQSKVEHYRVILKEDKLTIDEEVFFDHLTKLVKHYEEDADGLCTQLMRALPKQGSLEYDVLAEKAFKDAGWVISRKELQIGESIGKGEFGDVLLGDWLGRKVAVKRLKENCRAAKQLLDEASLMTSLTHENLVDLLGMVFDGSSILLVTEYMSKGSLVDYLRSRGRLHVTSRDQIMFACDTAAGMAYLESRRVVHRDLAARNVLISQNAVAKVCDFGLAKSSNVKLDAVKFPIKWTAPDALRTNVFSNKSDMWSFGILLWEIYSFGRVPYPKIPLADVLKYVEKGYRMDAPDGCPPEVYAIMREAWSQDQEARPRFEEVRRRLLEIKESTPGPA